MNNSDDNLNEVQHAMTIATTSYENAIGHGHSLLLEGALDSAFQWYTEAVGNAWRLTLLISDDDTTSLNFWRNEMNNAQQLATALAVLLKARNMTLPTW